MLHLFLDNTCPLAHAAAMLRSCAQPHLLGHMLLAARLLVVVFAQHATPLRLSEDALISGARQRVYYVQRALREPYAELRLFLELGSPRMQDLVLPVHRNVFFALGFRLGLHCGVV